MKEFFKYQQGYVNIDDDNLYLTTTGVWSEAKQLKEKPSQKAVTKKKRKEQKNIVLSFLFSVIWVLIFVFYFKSGDLLSLSLFLAPTVKLLYLYFFDTDFKIKIPLEKIKMIHVNKNQLIIEFLNAEGESDEEVLNNVEEKGIKLIEVLSFNLNNG